MQHVNHQSEKQDKRHMSIPNKQQQQRRRRRQSVTVTRLRYCIPKQSPYCGTSSCHCPRLLLQLWPFSLLHFFSQKSSIMQATTAAAAADTPEVEDDSTSMQAAAAAAATNNTTTAAAAAAAAAITPQVEKAIQAALADESMTELRIESQGCYSNLTVIDAQCIMACLRENPTRFHSLIIQRYRFHDSAAVLNIFLNGLKLCTSITSVSLCGTKLCNEGLECLLPAFCNTSVTSLDIGDNNIGGPPRGGQVVKDLLLGSNKNLMKLSLSGNSIGREEAGDLGQGLRTGCCHCLQHLALDNCDISNEGLTNLVRSMMMMGGGGESHNNSCLRHLDLGWNAIAGAKGGRQVRLLLQHCFPTLKVLQLEYNDNFGPLGARALAAGLAAARHLESLGLGDCGLGNDGVANLLMIPNNGQLVNNRSLTNLDLHGNHIQGAEGGRQVSLLLQRWCPTLKVLQLNHNFLGPLGAGALAPGLAAAASRCLESLEILSCGLGNDGVACLVPTDDGHQQVNNSSVLTNLDLGYNGIQGAEGGRQVSLFLQRCPTLKVLKLNYNHRLGPLGAHALAPVLAASRCLESLEILSCGLGNDGVASLVPDGQVNRSLTYLDLRRNDIQGTVGGENVVALADRCPCLDRLDVDENALSPDQRRRLDLLLDGNRRLCTQAQALAGSTFPVLFRFVEKSHRHEHGLSAIFVILQNDGDGYFCNAAKDTCHNIIYSIFHQSRD